MEYANDVEEKAQASKESQLRPEAHNDYNVIWRRGSTSMSCGVTCNHINLECEANFASHVHCDDKIIGKASMCACIAVPVKHVTRGDEGLSCDQVCRQKFGTICHSSVGSGVGALA